MFLTRSLSAKVITKRSPSKHLFLYGHVALVAIVASALPFISYAAELSFSPSTGSYTTGQEIAIKVMVKPDSESVNASDGTITFDKDILSISSFTKDGSAFSLWTSEPSFSNTEGTFTYSGGTPSALSKDGMILTIKFRGKKAGTATLSFSKGSVLAADGQGTDVYTKGNDATLTITDAAPRTADAADTSDGADMGDGEDAGPPPVAPQIDSSTFPKEDSWYSTTTGMFSWDPPPDVTGVRVMLSTRDNETPDKELKGVATSTVISGFKDGANYFYAQYKSASGWGDVAKRKVQIDTAPPKEFDVALVDAGADGGVPKLTFKAEDSLSGIDHYDILFGSTVVATVLAKDLPDAGYPVPPQEGGPTMVTIKAYDKAANVTDAKRELTLPKVAKQTKKSEDANTAPQPMWTIERILTILFALIIGILGTLLYKCRKTTEAEKLKILHRVSELGDRNDRIFSAMREEFEQMVNNFDVRPQLTPAERDFLEQIKEVLDVSEELVDTGIDELKKLIRGQ